MKIAIVKLSALGDIVHAMVVLQFVKKHYPDSEIDWIVDKRFQSVLENNPHINQIHAVNLNAAKKQKSLKIFLKELIKVRKYGKYDLIIDAQGLVKSAIVTKLMKGVKTVGFDKNSIREPLASYLYSQKVSIGYDENTIERYISLIYHALNIKVLGDELINKNIFLFSSSKVRIPDKPYVVFVIGSTWENRNYPKEKFIKVAQSLNKICLVLWGNELERKKANWMSVQSNFIEVMPKLTIDDLKHVVLNSSLVIGNDTGPTHMAWALNKPSITLFGPTPITRVYQTPINKVLKSSSKVNHFKLDKNDFSIQEIKVNDIIKIANVLLRKNI
ncbi:lipopolysaccharide heptosyltransferase I [Candidatus Thioglobus sp.]|nr:lipopolysaccharide heptosyltransferase I [Candidatus Thioglobus sp.]